MTTEREQDHRTSGARHTTRPPGSARYDGRHEWMIACCMAMPAIAVILVASRVVGVGFLIIAAACTLMTALMTGGLTGGGFGDNAGSGRRQG